MAKFLQFKKGKAEDIASQNVVVGRTEHQEDITMRLAALTSNQREAEVTKGSYEGGLKIWECTRDLMGALWTKSASAPEELKGARVLDMGCGQGVLGVWCLRHGASVCFQDLNQEVLETVTSANISLNLEEDVGGIDDERVSLVCGTWGDLPVLLESSGLAGAFSLVVSSESLYREEDFEAVYAVLDCCLGPKGQALLASKKFYFGVGGGTSSFLRYVRDRRSGGGTLDAQVWRSFEDTKSNVREILQVTREPPVVHEPSQP
uniref:protein-histidine N-methyltransferase n=1 Tax=Chromera velia CCMP2878 TaxID=1169474 RepID=A0A0G4FBX1_9ALVE|mmetsp:Transcript_3388/g.7005  ORF Transcript_3388/g.7005 Transcript_3388/m.7005 type:complete len:262 (+) Transcript_3388:240-1025(+)|eukprot:Cvel_16265.t1-p1 / transcript=Cvel_16265.t1 / gene=Cvel_16265 / organism=Chromera_velia_CCMP2878 / gene_product=Histidine protein methyltransferase 1 homolog, putative / transcript_product=Histidine protein methyltransferase 1 homolog, putative / location=Cvel_scaffold1245:17628-19648(-) / protein_length=261 / sequence_SO=supercontig / SO=protein_coding / is_pseudo=false